MLGGPLPVHGDPPGDVVAVWLFASSNFSRSSGRAVFTDITLTTAGETIPVLYAVSCTAALRRSSSAVAHGCADMDGGIQNRRPTDGALGRGFEGD
jgi:hypothetical protein